MAAAAGAKVGIDGAVYRNTGTYASPTWVEIDLVRDAEPTFPWDMGDASARTTRAKLYAKTQADLGVKLTVRADDANAGYGALWDAAMSGTALLDMLVLNGPLTKEGAKGVRANWNVSEDSESQGAGDVVYSAFTLKPGYSTDGVPSAITVGASSAITATAF